MFVETKSLNSLLCLYEYSFVLNNGTQTFCINYKKKKNSNCQKKVCTPTRSTRETTSHESKYGDGVLVSIHHRHDRHHRRHCVGVHSTHSPVLCIRFGAVNVGETKH